MHKNTKAIIQACQKASTNLRRDILEVIHLQTSRNLKNFLRSSQNRFEIMESSQIYQRSRRYETSCPNISAILSQTKKYFHLITVQ